MSFESQGPPEVYPYAPAYHSSLNTPLFGKQIVSSGESHHNDFRPNYIQTHISSHVPPPSNNYQIRPLPIASIPPLNNATRANSIPAVVTSPKPEITIDSKIMNVSAQPNSIFSEHSGNRFESYLESHPQEYKYNIFSFADEPWNRCLSGDGCGKLPSN